MRVLLRLLVPLGLVCALVSGCIFERKPDSDAGTVTGCEEERGVLARVQELEKQLAVPGSELPADNVSFALAAAHGFFVNRAGPIDCKKYVREAQPIAESIVRAHVPEIRAKLQEDCRRITRNYHDNQSQHARAELAEHLRKLGEQPGECAPVPRGPRL